MILYLRFPPRTEDATKKWITLLPKGSSLSTQHSSPSMTTPPPPFTAWYGVPNSNGGGTTDLWRDVSNSVWQSILDTCTCPVDDTLYYGETIPDWSTLGLTPIFVCIWNNSGIGSGAVQLSMYFVILCLRSLHSHHIVIHIIDKGDTFHAPPGSYVSPSGYAFTC